MKPLQKRNSLLLVLAAFIWGIAFVAQSKVENQSVLIHSTASAFCWVPLSYVR